MIQNIKNPELPLIEFYNSIQQNTVVLLRETITVTFVDPAYFITLLRSIYKL